MSVIVVNNNNFSQEVLQSDKPVLVDFFATWCGPCKMLSPIVDQLADEHPEVKVCKLDVDENQDLAQQFQVMSIPTLILFKDGQAASKVVGLQTKAALEQLIK
ncbi:MAG TPA: thioredoxin [Candidatus Scybalocola faecigallinarum]|mgnify:FL=1|uniref:Thioredoxin n=1 Tax=Candidatus Scybalocola faecigallinarum TaxID=2840941 RepID=A0A9D1F3M3_9FIRM|nr:thioredoxin [Candidatus Scybalocola faecigallinarum]